MTDTTTRIGYACINMTLSNPSKQSGLPKVTTGRSIKQAGFYSKGLGHVGALALQNAQDLLTILKWNERNGIRFFRLGSDLFPRHDHYETKVLPNYEACKEMLQECGRYAKEHGHRITTHPGPFHVLGSTNPAVVERTIIGLERHSEVFDLMGFEPSFDNKINIHVGSAMMGRDQTAKQWIEGWRRLSESTQARVVLENDDKASLYSVQSLYNLFHQEIGIPITFDYWHHTFCAGDLSEEQAIRLAASTWPSNVRQAVHYSESRRDEQPIGPIKIREQAHADYVRKPINIHGLSLDIMLEAKAKELALFEYIKLHS